MTAKSKSIVVVGSANVDFIMKVPHLPARGETVGDGAFFQMFGGKGANQTVAAARAGGNVAFIGGIGDDAFGSQIKANLEQESIDTTGVLMTKDDATGCALIVIDAEGNNTICVAPGANAALTPEHIDSQTVLLRNAALIVMQKEIPTTAIRRVLEIAEANDVPVLFNYAPASVLDLPVTSAMTGLVVNEIEAEALIGMPLADDAQMENAANELRSRGTKWIIMTLGAAGCLVAAEAETFRVPAFEVKAVDTTAAGDVFCGALAAALVEGKSLREATVIASAASAISVTRIGAQPSIPTGKEIAEFLSIHANTPDLQL
jgi:ribokinase